MQIRFAANANLVCPGRSLPVLVTTETKLRMQGKSLLRYLRSSPDNPDTVDYGHYGLPITSHVALAAFAGSHDGMWVIDSGADSHVCMDIALMHNIRPADSSIAFGNGTAVKVEVVGDVKLAASSSSFQSITLHDVLYVPAASANLLSVSHATKQGAQVQFTQDECRIHLGSTTVLTAQRSNGLYCFKDTSQRHMFLTATEEDPELWHRRFGHLGYLNLAKMQQLNMVSGIAVQAEDFKRANDKVCEPCIMAKQTRTPFPTSASVTTRPLELLHMDLCGPMPVTSLGGHLYIATFLDDYSKLSVVRVISSKSDTVDIVPKVIAAMENSSGYKVGTVRTDNGGEYINSFLSDYFSKRGVVHQTTIPYTPEQNGVAERLNRTLMERVRAMLNDAQLPYSLWAEAVLTANYLRNRSPVANKDKTPWELFAGRKPNVSRLRTFGARAYVHVPKQKRTKLDSVSERGIMVGYATSSKA